MIFVRRVDKVLNFRYNKKVKIESCTNCTANFLCAFVIFAMYLTRTAGIETHTAGEPARPVQQCILPALRELKPQKLFSRVLTIKRMYLTRTAGIETAYGLRTRASFLPMYLTRTAGIETY